MPSTRNDKILSGLSKDLRILEIGPSYAPLVPKRDGWKSWTVDHASRAELVEKFTPVDTIDTSKIEDVDFVWAGGRLDAAVPSDMHGTFDACVSSHVIEHIPDFAGFFISLSRLLKTDGVVAMAVPDKRFCFDFFRPVSSTGRIIEAHVDGSARHSLAARFDQHAYACSNDEITAWGQTPVGKLRLVAPSIASARGLVSPASSDAYTDCHGWQFTPASFELIVLELRALGVIDFEVTRTFPTVGCEFFVQLRKGAGDAADDAAIDARRLALLERMVEETGEQADWLRAGSGVGSSLAKALGRQVMERGRQVARRLLRPFS